MRASVLTPARRIGLMTQELAQVPRVTVIEHGAVQVDLGDDARGHFVCDDVDDAVFVACHAEELHVERVLYGELHRLLSGAGAAERLILECAFVLEHE